MKLADHVEKLKKQIESAFDKYFARLGFSEKKLFDIDVVPDDFKAKRDRYQVILDNHIAEYGDYGRARKKLIEELTFTLFNRLAAVKVMEAASLFPPILTKLPVHGNRSFAHKAWLEENPEMKSEELEGIRDFIKYAFDDLGTSIPLYSRSYPYAILPDPISLNNIIDSFNAVEKDEQVGGDIWESDDILGWLYESYNNDKKQEHKESGNKTEFDKVSIQSQVYTPRWVVMFLVDNSLVKLYLEMYPDSKVKDLFKVANVPGKRIREPKPLHEIKMIDPAAGSLNFMLYGFDVFYELYMDQIENYGADYQEDDIPRLIIENNLHAIDLDDRAIQLGQLGLFIKAKKKQRDFASASFNVVSSDFFLPDYDVVRNVFEENTAFDKKQKELIEEVWGELQNAHKFGSLITVGKKLRERLEILRKQEGTLFQEVEITMYESFIDFFFRNLHIAVEKYAKEESSTFLASKTKDAITFLRLISQEYDVAVANPPYTDGGDFGTELKKFIEDNYKKPYKFHANLYATFIKRCYDLASEDGKIAMIHPRTFMFIKTFEDVRKFIIEKTHINVFVDYSLSNLFGAIMVDPAFYVLEKGKTYKKDSWFISLDQYTRTPNEKYKKDFCLQALDDYINGKENEHNFSIPQSKLKIIKSWPFIYWISDEFREKFGIATFKDKSKVAEGLTTANNNRFLRLWWEIRNVYEKTNHKWVPYAKGGSYNKYFGNMWSVINWENNGSEIKNNKGASVRNEDYYFKSGITFSSVGSKGVNYRILEEGCVFDSASRSIFIKNNENLEFILATLNSKLLYYVANCLNPTVSTTVGDVERLPYPILKNTDISTIKKITKICIQIKKRLCTFSLLEMNFSKSPINNERELNISLINFLSYENHLLTQVLINEAIINEKVFEIYELTSADKAIVLTKEGESIGGLPVDEEARTQYLAETEATKEFPLDNIRDFILELPAKEFTPEKRQEIESGFPALYQSNNDLEEFCIRNHVNPINVWWWFKQSNVIPRQRMHTLAMEFLVDMVREILMEDEDGIIPLVPNAGEKVLIDRIENKFYEKGFSHAQYSNFDSVLGRPIDEYLNRYFFKELSDHLNLFMYLPKTPFIWHISSGEDQGFDCFIIIYKWNRDKLFRIRSVYIEQRERALVNKRADLADNNSAEAQSQKELIFRQLNEIESLKTKIDELLSEGYNPILDDGVGKNIAPLQDKGIIPYEVLNKSQLKKYLNADW